MLEDPEEQLWEQEAPGISEVQGGGRETGG